MTDIALKFTTTEGYNDGRKTVKVTYKVEINPYGGIDISFYKESGNGAVPVKKSNVPDFILDEWRQRLFDVADSFVNEINDSDTDD